MSDSDESKRKLIAGWQQPAADLEIAPSHAIQDLIVGGALLGTLLGPIIIAEIGWARGSDPMVRMVSALASAIGVALLGLIVGLIGQWLASRLGSKQPSRPGVVARLRHSGLAGLLGGPLIMVVIRGFNLSIAGVIGALLFGAIFWTLCALIGGVVGALIEKWRSPNRKS